MRIDNELYKESILSLICGSISLVTWLIPYISMLFVVVGVVTGFRSRMTEYQLLSYLGIIFSFASLGFSLLRSFLPMVVI